MVTTGDVRRATVLTNRHHHQRPAFYRQDALHVTQPTVSKH